MRADEFEEFIKKLSSPLADALAQFNYSFTAEERESDTAIIFEFTSQEAPRIEVRIDL